MKENKNQLYLDILKFLDEKEGDVLYTDIRAHFLGSEEEDVVLQKTLEGLQVSDLIIRKHDQNQKATWCILATGSLKLLEVEQLRIAKRNLHIAYGGIIISMILGLTSMILSVGTIYENRATMKRQQELLQQQNELLKQLIEKIDK